MRIDERLKAANAQCFVWPMGVFHYDAPGNGIFEKIDEADIITLELVRGAVSAGLAGENGTVLQANSFWREIIDRLKDHCEDKRVVGVATNRDARMAVRRLRAHEGFGGDDAPTFTVEVQEEHIHILSALLSADQLAELKTYKWLRTDDLVISGTIAELVNDLVKKLPSGVEDLWKRRPFAIFPGLNFVHCNVEQLMVTNNPSTAFMAPPHPSVLESREKISDLVRGLPMNLSDEEVESVTRFAVESFLYAPSCLTEAQEISYALDQYIKNNLRDGQTMRILHIGGSAHTYNITHVLNESIKNSQRIQIGSLDDPRAGNLNGDISVFFREATPFNRQLADISIVNHDSVLDPQKAAEDTKITIEKHWREFQKRIFIWRILWKQFKAEKFYSPEWMQTRQALYEMDGVELERLAAK